MKKISRAVLVLAAAVTLLPAAALGWLSLQTGNGVGFDQYGAIWMDKTYWLHYGNSLKLTVLSLLLALPPALAAGLMLAMRRRKGMVLAYFIALLMPFQVVTLPLFQLAIQTGLYDTHGVIILLSAFAPLGVLVCWVLMEQIPAEQWDAALLDTSSLGVIAVRIILPQILPGLGALCILLWSESWNMVEQPLILLQTRELMPLSLIYNDIRSSADNCAGAVLYALPIGGMYLLAAGAMALKRLAGAKR